MTIRVDSADGPNVIRQPTAASAPASEPSAGCTLETIGITKAYGAAPVVNTVSLTVPPGRLLTLLGPSGCGQNHDPDVDRGLRAAVDW